jgi:hypothetical protein
MIANKQIMDKLKQPLILGMVVATPGALEALKESGQCFLEFINRHRNFDWGDVCKEDWNLNNQSVLEGTRILSSYHTKKGEKIWIITEADRSSTCLLLPNEY